MTEIWMNQLIVFYKRKCPDQMKRMKPGAPPQVSCRSEMVVIPGAHNTCPWKVEGAWYSVLLYSIPGSVKVFIGFVSKVFDSP